MFALVLVLSLGLVTAVPTEAKGPVGETVTISWLEDATRYNPDQANGYETLSKNCLDATYDTTANWSEAKAEIDANRPFKIGIPGHARACAGWKKQNIFIIGQKPNKWLYIYDPWPWNADPCKGGKILWEDWDAVTHTNFIYVRHRATPCT